MCGVKQAELRRGPMCEYKYGATQIISIYVVGGPFTATPVLSYGAVKIKLSNEIRIIFLGDRDGCLKLSFIDCLLASIKLDFNSISFILFS